MERTEQKILIAPHNDDEALFASFICLRERPLVIIATDSWTQFNRGETSITAEVRRNESIAAMKVLGCPIQFLGIPDNRLSRAALREALKRFDPDTPTVYAPAIQGGNKQHDLVGRVALGYFKHVILYCTYSEKEDYTTGEIELRPTPEELDLKDKALDCYRSQIAYAWTAHHFAAVRGKSEWITTRTSGRSLLRFWHHWRT